MRIGTVIAVASLLSPLDIAAQIVPVGTEFQISTHTRSSQRDPAVATSVDGIFVVVWSSQDSSADGVFGQRYDRAVQPLGTEFQVNSYTTGYQHFPAVAASADGAFVVTWQSRPQDGSGPGGVFGRRYNSAGQVMGTEFQVNSYTLGSQRYPAVAAGADGDFIVAWESGDRYGGTQDGSNVGVFGQRYDSMGQALGTEFQVNSYTLESQRYPAVAAGADGAFVVAWNSYTQDGSSEGVFGQRYNSVGRPVGTEFQVNSSTTYYQRFPAVAAGVDGAFTVAWSNFEDGDFGGVFGRRYDSIGEAVGTEFQINTYTPGYQRFPAVAAAADGNIVVVWEDERDGSSGGVVGQLFDSVGQLVGTEFQVNSYTPSFQRLLAVGAGADGKFLVAWTSSDQDGSSYGLFGQRFAVPFTCPGDCDGNGILSVDELITGVAIALDQLPIHDCTEFDIDESGRVSIDELVAAVDAALNGCTD